jgi:hypothetical protein
MLTKNTWLDILLIVLACTHICIMTYMLLGLWNQIN